jgi:hypothetical protein
MAAPVPGPPKLQKRVDEILVELGVGLRPMPTAAVAKHFQKLKQDIATLLELQKAVATKEYHLQRVRGQTGAGAPPTTATATTVATTPVATETKAIEDQIMSEVTERQPSEMQS